ncbi:hypothetical protein C8J56DRAFT_907764 [Mycena floridula]|nr:hypothetical protein C8J56DRAFT_907764 [Mycena floridula]
MVWPLVQEVHWQPVQCQATGAGHWCIHQTGDRWWRVHRQTCRAIQDVLDAEEFKERRRLDIEYFARLEAREKALKEGWATLKMRNISYPAEPCKECPIYVVFIMLDFENIIISLFRILLMAFYSRSPRIGDMRVLDEASDNPCPSNFRRSFNFFQLFLSFIPTYDTCLHVTPPTSPPPPLLTNAIAALNISARDISAYLGK